MKQIMLVICILISTTAYTQTNLSNNSTIPVPVTDAFLKKFPNSTEVNWGDNYSKSAAPANTVYFVSFRTTMSNKTNEVWLDKDGNMLKHRKEIETSALPDEVQRSLARNFSGYTVTGAERWEENNRVSYMMVIKDNAKEKTVVMDSNGMIKDNTVAVPGEFVK